MCESLLLSDTKRVMSHCGGFFSSELISTIIIAIIIFVLFFFFFRSNPLKLIRLSIIHIVICATPGLVVIIDFIDWLGMGEK